MGIVCMVLGIVFIIIDQVTKRVAVQTLADGDTVGAIPGVFDFLYVENRGAAFGMLQNARWLLIVISIALLLLVVRLAVKKCKQRPLLLFALTLVSAGGIGNMIDRIFRGYVVDFIHLLFMDFPCFNFADMCVCVGAVLLAIDILFTKDSKGSGDGHGADV